MTIRGIFRRLDRLAGRFNRWFAPAALATGAVKGGRVEQADPQRVAAILGEIDKRKPPGA
jgi:hypothetical protein